jgi:hypothetical protein
VKNDPGLVSPKKMRLNKQKLILKKRCYYRNQDSFGDFKTKIKKMTTEQW